MRKFMIFAGVLGAPVLPAAAQAATATSPAEHA